mgnify:CR=1 FL=1
MSDCINSFSEEKIAGLLTLAQQGDKDAVSKLVDMALPIVEAQARSFSGNGFEFADLSQEGMIGVLCAIGTYNKDAGASFKTYLNICVKNRLLSVIRKRSEKSVFFDKAISLSTDDSEMATSQSLEEQLIGEDGYKRIFEFIDSELSKKERETLLLFISGLSYEKIADKTGATVKAVDGTLQRARKKLKLFK